MMSPESAASTPTSGRSGPPTPRYTHTRSWSSAGSENWDLNYELISKQPDTLAEPRKAELDFSKIQLTSPNVVYIVSKPTSVELDLDNIL